MKKILMLAFIALPLCLCAKKNVDSKYLQGAVPMVDGRISFQKTLSIGNKSQDEAFRIMHNLVCDTLMSTAIESERSRVIMDNQNEKQIVAKVEEYMTFKRKPFNLDRTRFRYQISAQLAGNEIKLEITQISYYYNEDMEGNNGIDYRGEEWITDEEAVNKKGTALYPRSGKFRIKTIDRVNNIFNKAETMLKVQ